MSKLGTLFLLLASMTLAWAGPGPDDAKAQPCKVTTRAGSHPCTAEEQAEVNTRQRLALEMYQPRQGAKPYTMEEQGRALRLLLLGPGASPSATQHDQDPAAERLQRLLSDSAEPSSVVDRTKPPKQ
jgi:hypothetical protein